MKLGSTVLTSVVLALVNGLGCPQSTGPTQTAFGTANGGVVYADDYGAGPHAVLLAHGGQFDKDSWRPQAPRLVSEGFRVLAINFRGYGDSSGPGDSDVLSAPLQHDVLAGVSYLRRTGTTRVSAVGASLGGWAVAAAVAAEPESFARVVFLGSVPRVPAERLMLPKLYIMTMDDASGLGSRRPALEAHVAVAPEPKRLVLFQGSAHAQHMFATAHAELIMNEIVSFLR